MDIRQLHPWQVTLAEATAIQQRLAAQVVRADRLEGVRLVAGADVHFPVRRDLAYAVVLVLSYPDLEPVEVRAAEREMTFPYRPGFLSFREVPPLLAAFEQVRMVPDLLFVDGQGIAHPRRLGLASHLGLVLDLPTIGCAKSRLTGVHEEPGVQPGDWTPLRDQGSGEVIGAVLRTRVRAKPLYISIGHKISLDEAVRWTLASLRGHRLPEPSLRAHNLASGHTPLPARDVP
ncbi:MAG: deoxyribonuclease V [Chloroflexi bacterium]|nr:deoxyribonuclease V [Chloroflexota bacterium]